MNNDAVVIFKDPAATLRELELTHEKFKVLPLPHQVFSKHSVWVDKDLSAVIQATPAYLETLKNIGEVDVVFDKKEDGYKVTGESYQIEWAWNYLSGVRDNQMHIAHTVQAESRTGSASLKLSNGDAHTNGDSDLDHHSPQEISHQSHRSAYSSRRKTGMEGAEAEEVEPVEREKLSVSEPVSSTLALAAAASSGHDITMSGARSLHHGGHSSRAHEENFDDDSRSPGGLGPSSLRMEAGSPGSATPRERRRQDDANNTFHQFASLPAPRGQGQHQSTADYNTRPGSSSRRGGVLATDLDQAEAEHKSERRFQSLNYSGTSDYDDYEPTEGFKSLQPDYDNYRTKGAYGGQREMLSRHLSHNSQYALHSSSVIGLSRKSFRVSQQLDMKLKLKIYVDDITRTQTMAVVNAANWELKNIGGVAGALAKAAGLEMELECTRLYNKNGPLATAQVVKTKAYGKLSHLKYVIHTVGPIHKTSEEDRSVYELTQTFYNCLEFADKLNLDSVAFPFISTGIFGMPVDDCVRALVTALHVFGYERLTSQPNKQFTELPALQEVHFIHNDINVVCQAVLMAEELFQKETAESALQRMQEGKRKYGRHVYISRSSGTDRASRLRSDEPGSYDAYGASGSRTEIDRRDQSRVDTLLSEDRDGKGRPYSTHIGEDDLHHRYASWDSSQPIAGVGAVDTNNSRSRSQHRSDALSDHSAPMSMPTAALRRSGSLDRGKKPLSSSGGEGKSSQALESREPSVKPRPRSNSVGVKKRSSPSTSSSPQTVVGLRSKESSPESSRGAAGGKHQPVIKKSIVPGGAQLKTGRLKRSANAGRSSDHSGNDTDSASAAGSEMDDADNSCPICLEPARCPKKLPCGHQFCTDCVDRAVAMNPKCPKCQRLFGIAKGTQPKNGTMTYTVSRLTSLPGYEGHGTIIIQYYIPAGTQEAFHPNPGRWYNSTRRTAYLPDNKEGNEVLKMLRKAFDHGLIFTVGDSVTSGARGVVTWNDIHHKTATHGGASGYGYPDPGYLKRVKEELAAKGITSA